ncbi:hypothetical protein Pmani_002251 [Petrolisthes manimaculis]|uniref:Reverse transcriptase domain-containing protein n=1 Tax=Petrolisthes manimaculis TaxID=1843537 RepID=A0AAE1QJ20_9EUCA|nr:hypothetical protein Pmani_002251 [Petrolisthes manimaculis]
MSNPSTSSVSNQQLSDLITNKLRNDYSKITSLLHYCGGTARHPDHPNFACETSAKEWIKDIDAKTKSNWTDEGRIELAEQYLLGQAKTEFRIIIDELKTNATWDNVKAQMLEIFPEGPNFDTIMRNLGEATREIGETLRGYYIRLHDMYNELTKKQAAHSQVFKNMYLLRFYSALPPLFQNNITSDERADGTKLLRKAIKLAATYPASKLRDEDVSKEKATTERVHVVATPPQGAMANQASPNKHWKESRTCFVCKKPGHIARNCYKKQNNWNWQSRQEWQAQQTPQAQLAQRRYDRDWGWPTQNTGRWNSQGNRYQSNRPQCGNCGKWGHETRVDGENLVQVKINGVEVSLNPKSDKAVTLIEGNKIVPPGCIDENDDSDKYDPNQIVEGPNWKTSTIESVHVPPSSVGYVNLVTHVVDVEEARFEPSQGNKQARVLCPGIVKLHRCPDETKSIFTVMYVNVETEGVEIEEGKTMGEVIPCEAQNFMEDEGIEEDVNSQSTRENLYRVLDSKFPPESRENEILRNLIKQYPRVFATQDDPLKVTPYYMCTLRQVDDDAVWRKPYPIPVKYHEDIKKQIKQLRAQGTIRPSRSPYNTPLVPVPKKDGGIRLCLDFRALNTKLKDDKYPLPNIQVILQQLGESKIFSCLDMYQGYHQIPLAEESMEKTAFTSPEGHWEFTALPFGIKTAPACFQRIVNSVLTGLVGNSVFVYLDDVIIYGKNLQSHVENLRKVLERLQEAKLTLKLEKCEFFKTEVDYLGHVVSAEGLKPQPSKVDAVRQMAQPETVKELQSFLGLINYYRKFIYKFSEVASPLISLMKGKANKKNNNTPLDWTPEARIAFEDLKSKLAEEVTLAFPNFAKPFMLTTDASDKSIGGVLQQKDDEGRMRPLTFFSRTLNPAETRVEVKIIDSVTTE